MPLSVSSTIAAAAVSVALAAAPVAISVAGVAIAASTPAAADTASPPRAPLTPEFKQGAAFFFAFGIATSKLALEKSPTATVKAFAQRTVAEHTDALAELIVRTGLRPDTEVAATAIPGGFVAPDQAAAFQQLKDAQGADFDRQYAGLQVDSHRRALVLFEDYAKYGDDWYMTEFAGRTAPTLRAHLDQAVKLSGAGS